MAGGPVAKWLLYGSDTPVRDFLTSDGYLRTMQTADTAIAATAAISAAVLYAGPVLVEAGATLGTSIATGLSALGTPALAGATAGGGGLGGLGGIGWATVGTAGLAMTQANPSLGGELAGELSAIGAEVAPVAAEAGPVLEQAASQIAPLADEIPQLAEELPALAEELPPVQEQAASLFQNVVRAAQTFLRANPDLNNKLGGSAFGREASERQVTVAGNLLEKGNPGFARMISGNAMEALVNAIIKDDPALSGLFEQLSGPGKIDFVGKGDFLGLTFELTTEAGVPAHALRAYMYAQGAMVFTYNLGIFAPGR